jgi:hypothetical protein
MKRIWLISVMLSALSVTLVAYSVPIGGPPPKIAKLIEMADAIVILRIDKHLSDFGSPTFYSTHECFIYQTIKGNIPKNTRIKLQLMNTEGSFATPYAWGSTHLMFLMKKATEDEPTEYRTVTVNGAQILLSPLGHEKLPEGKTIEEKVINLIKDTILYQAQEYEKKQKFLKEMIGEPKGVVYASEQALWLQTCVNELARNKTNEVRWFNGIGANDVKFIPEVDPAEEIFRKCESVKPLSADKVSIYKKWLEDRISEIQSINVGSTRKQVNQILLQNGEIFTPSAAIYSHKDCQALKVRIEFEPVSDKPKSLAINENDKVKSVSTPYLGFFIID